MENLELERKYLAQIAIEPQGTDKLRHQLVNRLADQIVSDPAGSLASEIHTKWWKLGYHKPIEHYRRLLKDKTGKAQYANAQMNQLVDEGLGTVMGLVRALLSKYDLQVDLSGLFLDLGLPEPSIGHGKFSCPAVQRLAGHLLVSAGDLARYRCQLRQTFLTQDRFSLSRLFYSQASACQPSFGHPYNMLAVVASQLDAPLETVYWYIRSQCCQEPSQMGRDNLLTFLKSTQMQKQKGLEPLVQLVLHSMFKVGPAPMRPTKFESFPDQARLWIALILVGLNWIQPFDIVSWYPFTTNSYERTSESQLIAYLGQRLRILQLPAKVCLDSEAVAMRRNLEGFLPVADADQLTQKALMLPPSSQTDEDIILFTGFKS